MIDLSTLAGVFGLGLLLILFLMNFIKAFQFNDPVLDILSAAGWGFLSYYALSLGGMVFIILTLLVFFTTLFDIYFQITNKPSKKLNLFKIKH